MYCDLALETAEGEDTTKSEDTKIVTELPRISSPVIVKLNETVDSIKIGWNAVEGVVNNSSWTIAPDAYEYLVTLTSGKDSDAKLISTCAIDSSTTFCDFYQDIFQNGYHDYYFDVKVIPTDAWDACYNESAVAESGELSFTDGDDPAEFLVTVGGVSPYRTVVAVDVYDTGSGIKAYAFSTEENISYDDPAWNSINLTRNEHADLVFTPAAAGAYYAYVRDAFGNVRRSENFINISVVHLEKYFEERK